MAELEVLLIKTRDLSTRHLQQYLDLFRFKKILKYTIEYLEQNEELYEYSLLQITDLKNNAIFKNEFPVDVSENDDMFFI